MEDYLLSYKDFSFYFHLRLFLSLKEEGKKEESDCVNENDEIKNRRRRGWRANRENGSEFC